MPGPNKITILDVAKDLLDINFFRYGKIGELFNRDRVNKENV